MATANPIGKGASWLIQRAQRLSGHNAAPNSFLEGPFAPVREEISTTELHVRGDIPVELDGILARIGPNPIQVPNSATHHWFMGDGILLAEDGFHPGKEGYYRMAAALVGAIAPNGYRKISNR